MRAVITGATSGIGKAMACQLAQDGWSLVLTGRNQTVLEQLQKNLPTAVEILPLDLAEEEAPYQLFDFCKKKRVDLLVNNAGFGIFGRFTETNLQEEMDLLAVNVRALHILTKLFLKKFQAQKHGRILNVASSAGFLTGPLLSSYYASKNYVVRLSLAIAEELRRQHSEYSLPWTSRYQFQCSCRGFVQCAADEQPAGCSVCTGKDDGREIADCSGRWNETGVVRGKICAAYMAFCDYL